MKLRFTIYDLRFTIEKKSPPPVIAGRRACAGTHRQSSIINHKSRQGFALVITLILLSVTLIMAVAFLAISRRERGSVVTTTDSATARYAADAALANAEAQIISAVLATTNPYINNLLVSTNYINASGFQTAPPASYTSPTNVSYVYHNGNPLSYQDFEQNVANLLYLPRVPVFVPTNALGASDFRFYLDLNRNGKFEDSGMVTNLDNANNIIRDSLDNPVVNNQVGDPQWIGVLERPDAPHGPNNKFLARYAFIAMPADGTLDLNAIHNQALHGNITTGASGEVNPPSSGDDYFRNQGIGSWEINLAAFLADLNTNQWGQVVGSGPGAPIGSATYYQYNQLGNGNLGHAFEDARALLAYRYNNTFASLAFVPALFPSYPLTGGPVDLFPFGPTMTGTGMPFYNYSLNNSWPGADNTNHFFALTSDLFDPAKVGLNVATPGFIERLNQAGTNNSTYDRYTLYRMLAQLGTDSSPDAGKLNLNYDNLDPFVPGVNGPVYDTNGVASLTNFAAWTPLAFFTNAADRMLRLYTTNWFQADPSNYLATYYGIYTNYYYTDVGLNIHTNDPFGMGLTNLPLFGMTNQIPAFGLTNIPVYVNGQLVYRSAVQRVLQLAANIYDASTNSFYPSRFRPVFTKMIVATSATTSTTNVYVSGYTNQVTPIVRNNEFLTPDIAPPITAMDFASLSAAYNYNQPYLLNIYGVPWIIGAKKGFPNFNEFSMENSIQVTRKLQLTRTINPPPKAPSNYQTNQMYSMAITNFYGLECWNSYFNRSNYLGRTGNSGPVVIAVRNLSSMTLTNYSPYAVPNANAQTIYTTNWLTYTLPSWQSNQFVVPLNTNAAFFGYTNPVYVYKYNQFGSTANFLDVGIVPLPQFGFVVTNYLQVAIIDYSDPASGGQIVDYAELGPLTGSPRNINAEIADLANNGNTGLWSTNLSGGLTPQGVINQITTSRNGGTVPAEDAGEGKWSQVPVPGLPPGMSTSQQGEQAFFTAFFSSRNSAPYGNSTTLVTNLQDQVQAPYTPSRLRVQKVTWQANDPLVHYLASDLNDLNADTGIQNVLSGLDNLGVLNNRYQPWDGNPNLAGNKNKATPDFQPTITATNIWLKDSLVTSSAKWDFPTSKYPTVGWLGRVHRGTPWQTVYLKSGNVFSHTFAGKTGANVWQTWTGNLNTNDTTNSAPVQDQLLFDLFTTAINDNATRGRLSVNVAADPNDPAAGLAAWSALFSGMAVPTSLTNYTVINPAGTFGVPVPAGPPASPNSPFCLGYLVQNGTNGINDFRTTFKNPDGLVGAFEHVGNILAVPALTEQSPFLTGLNPDTQISDELYEWLPQQAMSLLRADGNPRYVIYCYGQTLKPAPNGVVTSGGQNYFGMVTNYQVVAETATRAVVQFRPVVVIVATNPVTHFAQMETNYSATLEQFNPLPPD